MSESATLSGNLLGIADALESGVAIARESASKRLREASEVLYKQGNEITALRYALAEEREKVGDLEKENAGLKRGQKLLVKLHGILSKEFLGCETIKWTGDAHTDNGDCDDK